MSSSASSDFKANIYKSNIIQVIPFQDIFNVNQGQKIENKSITTYKNYISIKR